MRRALFALIVLFCAALPAMAAKCVNPAGSGGCYSSIQAAVNAAVPGEIVRINPGTYFENVTIPPGLNGLTLRGLDIDRRNRTILDPDSPNSGAGITIQSSQVTVQFLKIRNGASDGIYIDADHALIADNVIISPESDGIELTSNADSVQLLRNQVFSVGSSGIYSSGTDSLFVEGNVIGICDDGCIDVDGNDIQVISNNIRQSEDDDCIVLDGDHAIVRDNTLKYCDGDAIDIYGMDPSVLDNMIQSSGGIDLDCVSCTGGLVRGNSIEGVGDDEGGLDIYADAAGLIVSNNTVANVSDEGAYLSGTGVLFQQNVIKENGGDNYEPGMEIYGSSHSVIGNQSISNADQGFYFSCSNCTISDNLAKFNMSDGYEINGTNNTLTNNRSIENAGEGFQLNGTAHTLTGNVAKQNRFDYCQTTSGHTLTNNTFPTTGTCAIDN